MAAYHRAALKGYSIVLSVVAWVTFLVRHDWLSLSAMAVVLAVNLTSASLCYARGYYPERTRWFRANPRWDKVHYLSAHTAFRFYNSIRGMAGGAGWVWAVVARKRDGKAGRVKKVKQERQVVKTFV